MDQREYKLTGEILENITVGGQSGSTTKAMAMTASPKMDVEVDKLILESG